MIPVTRVNNQRIHINPDLIEAVEESGDTVLVLTNGHRLVVRESAEQIVERVLAYRKRLISGMRVFESVGHTEPEHEASE